MLGVFTNDLPVHLTFRRNIDNNVVKEFRVTTQAPTFRERAFSFVKFDFCCYERRKVLWARRHLVLLERSRHTRYLAATAETAATTDRVDVNTERSSSR